MTPAPKVCGTPGCTTLTRTARCPEHTPKPWASSDRRARLPADWERRRRRILARDDHTCQACHNAVATEVDHINNGDDHSDSNLQAICSRCHRTKTLDEAAQARRA